MSVPLLVMIGLSWLAIVLGCWLGWQLLRQNGRMLLRLDELEKRLDELEFGEPDPRSSRGNEGHSDDQGIQDGKDEMDQSLVTSAATNGDKDDRAARFSGRSLARSKLKRDGLKAGTPAPNFRLPRLDGRGDLSLDDLRGSPVLLVFSDPHCGPCQALAPHLEKFHRERAASAGSPPVGGEGEIPSPPQIIMISRGEPKESRAKAKEFGLSFPVVLQRQWEISRLYAMFATPIAYLIDESGVITHDVGIGVEPILKLMAEAKTSVTVD
jgi:peroxiredoxin